MNVLERLEALAEKGAPRPWRHSVAGWVFEGTGESSEPVAIAHEVNGADVRAAWRALQREMDDPIAAEERHDHAMHAAIATMAALDGAT